MSYYDKTYEDTPLDPKYNQVHIPGANGRGTNYVVTDDRVYIVEGRRLSRARSGHWRNARRYPASRRATKRRPELGATSASTKTC